MFFLPFWARKVAVTIYTIIIIGLGLAATVFKNYTQFGDTLFSVAMIVAPVAVFASTYSRFSKHDELIEKIHVQSRSQLLFFSMILFSIIYYLQFFTPQNTVSSQAVSAIMLVICILISAMHAIIVKRLLTVNGYTEKESAQLLFKNLN